MRSLFDTDRARNSDALEAARGVIHGLVFGLLLWALILVAAFYWMN